MSCTNSQTCQVYSNHHLAKWSVCHSHWHPLCSSALIAGFFVWMHSFQNRVALSKATSLQRQTLRLVSNALPGIYFHECLAQIQHVNTCKMSSPFPLPHFEKVETSAKNLISGPNDVNFCHFLLRTPAARVYEGGKKKKINRTQTTTAGIGQVDSAWLKRLECQNKVIRQNFWNCCESRYTRSLLDLLCALGSCFKPCRAKIMHCHPRAQFCTPTLGNACKRSDPVPPWLATATPPSQPGGPSSMLRQA